ncbi:MAG: U32 family peptidase, partial [Enterobacter sp.]|nr:U32 family peptidase [Enterobacter sp.]
IPAVNNLMMLETIVSALRESEIYCTRFNETHGSFLRSDREIKEMLQLCHENNYGMLFGLGPRPEYDVKSSFYRTEFGMEQGRQLNNNDAISHSIEEALRLSELGCRGLIVYDPGVLFILNELRKKEILPANMKFKTSSHCMVTNAIIARLMADAGADSITTAHDLSLATMYEIRRFNPDLVIDIPIDVYASKGGYLRFYEVGELAQIAAPMYLKVGASAQSHPYDSVGAPVAIERVRRLGLVLDHLQQVAPELQKIDHADPTVCLPQQM